MAANTAPISQEIDKISDLESSRMRRILQQQQAAFRQQPMPSATERIAQLKRLKAAVIEYQDKLAEAISEDFSGRSKTETQLAEILTSVDACNSAIKHVKGWMKPSKRKVNLLFKPATNRVYYQPLGVIGIIVPWNYPVYLAVGPLISALAAGNRALIKMSEFTPATNSVFKKMIASAFSEEQVAVIEGEAEIAKAFSELPFNHLLFTGSTQIGRHVMAAAAKNLTPVTLELGGKSPAIVSRNASLQEAAERICYGKSLNAGQTCVAPDYILLPREKEENFIKAYTKAFERMFPTLKDNNDYTAIINPRQYQRLQAWLADAKSKGAQLNELNPSKEALSDTRKMPPVIVQNLQPDMQIANEEIFGPILPIVPYDTLDQALAYVNDRPRPLALYFFSKDKKEQKHVLQNTHSGGVSINDTLKHLVQDDMPFGGAGDSGIGHYHGKEGFLTFSKAKAVHQTGAIYTGNLVFPPYNPALLNVLKRLFIR